jgi:hypothetical protein
VEDASTPPRIGLDQVQAAVNVDAIGLAYAPGSPLNGDFHH